MHSALFVLPIYTRRNPIGSGNLCWHKILQTAAKLGIENYVVEDDMGVLDPFASAAESIAYLRQHL